MVGDTYYSTGISLIYTEHHGEDTWTATAKFFDGGFGNDLSTEGEIHTRYFQGIETAIDTCKADAERLGIVFRMFDGLPRLYIEGDGESSDWPPPPGWRDTLQKQAARIGWETYHSEEKLAAILSEQAD